MKTLSLTIMAMTMATGLAIAETVNFDDMKVGVPPPGWTATQTGSGTAKWAVEKDESAPSKPNVLKQSRQATFPVCIKDDTSLKDGFVEVKFKAISAKRIRPAVSSGGQRTRTITTSRVPMRSKTMSPFITRSMAGAQR